MTPLPLPDRLWRAGQPRPPARPEAAAAPYPPFSPKSLPAGVACCVLPIAAVAPRPRFAEEEAAILRSSPKRRAEFLTGRACARVALAALGADAQPIPAKEDRSPCWPQGYVGSISHSGSHCIAIAARARDFASLGADLETTTPLTAQLIPLVVHRGDRLGGGAEAVGAKRAFVAKEAYYKALYPLRGQLLDFLDVAVDLGGSSGAFRASLRRDGGADLLGSFSVLAGHYLAIVVAAAAGDGAGAA